MTFWIALWKSLFIVGVTIFAFMAVWVTIYGFKDIRKLLERIDSQHQLNDREGVL